MLLQTLLSGKAQKIYASPSVEDSAEYHLLESAILKSYELVLEAYRQKFRNHRKSDAQTYVEFIRQKETYFDRWNTANNVENEYEKLK